MLVDRNRPIHFIADISRHACGNGIVLVGVEEGCTKEDFINLMILANREGYVDVTIKPRQGAEKQIESVNPECEIYYSDGTTEPCPFKPAQTFSECGPGYNAHSGCPKYKYHHSLDGPGG